MALTRIERGVGGPGAQLSKRTSTLECLVWETGHKSSTDSFIKEYPQNSGTFITHTCPLFPLISTCISVPFGFHWALHICYNVHWCVWVPVLCILGFRALVDCADDCRSRVLIIVCMCYIFEVLLALLFGFQPCVFVTCLFGLRPRAFTRQAIIWVQFKALLRIPASVSRIIHASMRTASWGLEASVSQTRH